MLEEQPFVQNAQVCEPLPQQQLKVGSVPWAELDCGGVGIYVHAVDLSVCIAASAL